MTALPPDVATLGLADLEGHRHALLSSIAARQSVIAAIRTPRPGGSPVRLVGDQLGRIDALREERARLRNMLRVLHELIEAVSCEEPFTPCSTPPST